MAADVLLAAAGLVAVVVVARCGGALAVRLGEPRIAGEMIGAILVGPTLLGGQIEGVVEGAQAVGVVGDLFPALSIEVLTVVGSVGMILYMLLVGVTIDPAPMARWASTILALSLSVVAGMGLVAVGAGAWLASDGGWRGPDGTTVAFTLALAAGLATHGVPIAARILEERGLLRSEVGGIIIAAGACTTTMALVAGGVAIRGADGAAVAELALGVAAGALLVAVAAPLGRSRAMRLAPVPAVIVLLTIALAAGAAGEVALGTVLLGPLIAGIAVRNAGFSAVFLEARLGTVVRGILLPVFLGVAALHTNLRELGAGTLVPVLTLLAAVVAVKVAAVYASARLAGFDRGQARAMGALLQCGGVMTIAISLDVLHEGIITTRTHAMLTLVGLVTTMLAGPLLAASRHGAAEGPPAPEGPVAPAAAVP
jgi:Kef-type K+ transport system membrane component KefB